MYIEINISINTLYIRVFEYKQWVQNCGLHSEQRRGFPAHQTLWTSILRMVSDRSTAPAELRHDERHTEVFITVYEHELKFEIF